MANFLLASYLSSLEEDSDFFLWVDTLLCDIFILDSDRGVADWGQLCVYMWHIYWWRSLRWFLAAVKVLLVAAFMDMGGSDQGLWLVGLRCCKIQVRSRNMSPCAQFSSKGCNISLVFIFLFPLTPDVACYEFDSVEFDSLIWPSEFSIPSLDVSARLELWGLECRNWHRSLPCTFN